VHSYSKDGAMRIRNATDPVYAPNSYGGPQADPARAAEVRWHTDGEMMRAAYTLRPEDDDWSQARPAFWSATSWTTLPGSDW
jgi:catalase